MNIKLYVSYYIIIKTSDIVAAKCSINSNLQSVIGLHFRQNVYWNNLYILHQFKILNFYFSEPLLEGYWSIHDRAYSLCLSHFSSQGSRQGDNDTHCRAWRKCQYILYWIKNKLSLKVWIYLVEEWANEDLPTYSRYLLEFEDM